MYKVASLHVGLGSRVTIKIQFRKKSAEYCRLGMVFVFLAKKVFLPWNSVYIGIAPSEVRNKSEFCEKCSLPVQWLLQAWIKKKLCFSKVVTVFFFVFGWLGTSFKEFFFSLMVQNENPSVFLFCELVRNGSQSFCYLLRNGLELNYKVPSVFSSYQMVLTEIPSFF